MSNLPYSEQYLQAAEKWVDLENAASILEETKSSVLSQWMLQAGDVSVARAELTVKGAQRWEEHVKKIVAARTEANKAKVFVEYLRMKFFENNSREATERTQAKL